MCETLWNIFNDNIPLQPMTDSRITKLNQVLNYFKAWKHQLNQTFQRRADVLDHFITWQTMFDLDVRCLGDYKVKPTKCRAMLCSHDCTSSKNPHTSHIEASPPV